MNGKVIEFFEILGEDSNLVERESYKNFGKYPVFSGQTKNKGIVSFINNYLYNGEFITWTTYGVKAGTVFYRKGKFSIGRNCAGLKLKEKYGDKINLNFIKILLQKKIIREMGSKDCRGNASIDLVSNIEISIPNIDEQNKIVEISKKEYEKFLKIKGREEKINKIKKLFSDLILEEEPIILCRNFEIILGTQFSEKEAYYSTGEIPVYTASISKPSYYVKDSLKEKVKVKGPCLIWARKGNAGKLKLIQDEKEFYITDVSGIIKPKEKFKDKYNLIFLRYYLESIFLKNLKSIENNPQLNKTYVESALIPFPEKDKQDEIVEIIKNKLV